ncbi:hypothetical protein [Flavobacterium silvaticum]|uniref:Redox-active disulfide protein 2 n=1 Tax=Flavobacterium silvaticum TaxID=1852020 RepID=A0A972FLP6_9FLAO|nr:hypothetical protein [Flavobacterium silvaticum]NMH27947.1 hypothetical protein [Flavobacterium silvaticum]
MKEENTKNKLSGLSVEELEKEKSKIKGVAIGLGIVMVSAAVILLFLMAKSGKFGLAAIIPAMFLTLMPILIRMSQVETELKSRKNNS